MALTLQAPEHLDHDHEPVAGTIGEPDQPEAAEQHSDEEIDEANRDLSEDADEQQDEQAAEDERFWRECEVAGQLAEAERKAQRLESKFNVLTDDRKDTKKELESAVLQVRRLASELADLADEHALPENPNKPAAAGDQGDGEAADENAWRDKPTRALLGGTKGLGAKKLDAICELAPTAGALEDLRGEASLYCVPFADHLPKGCGQAIADAIEDALINLVAESAPSAAEQAAAEKEAAEQTTGPDGQIQEAPEQIPEADSETEPVSDDSDTAPADGDYEDADDEEDV